MTPSRLARTCARCESWDWTGTSIKWPRTTSSDASSRTLRPCPGEPRSAAPKAHARRASQLRKSDKRASFDVLLDANELGPQQRVGTLYTNGTRTDMPASFEYETGWLESRHAFMLDPRLALWTGEQHPQANAPALVVFMASCPDRWGRWLRERREAAQAKREGRPART